MNARLVPPVHLYVKTHRVTGLKYFGRTTQNPHRYRGSGAYWRRHLEKFGNFVDTTIVGTYYDEESLRKAALEFSELNNIAESSRWANLLPEDGSVDGEGWRPTLDHSKQIAKLDRAVEKRLANKETSGGKTVRENSTGSGLFEDKTLVFSAVVVSTALGFYMMGSLPNWGLFFVGALMGVLTPVGWLGIGALYWILKKFSE